VRNNDEHESTRRLKNEFLSQFDGATTSCNERVTVMGATNRPQDLDEAARRRLSRRIYVPLPCMASRKQLIENLLKDEGHLLSPEQIQQVAEMCEGFSGHDISLMCRDAAMGPVRELQKQNPGISLPQIDNNTLRSLHFQDFVASLKAMKSSVAPEECRQFEEWNKKFGTNSSF